MERLFAHATTVNTVKLTGAALTQIIPSRQSSDQFLLTTQRFRYGPPDPKVREKYVFTDDQ
jgi:hypothetical protein